MFEQLDANNLMATLPCAIRLPDNWTNYFTRTGPLPPVSSDRRRFPRFYLRAPAALSYRSTLPALPRPKHECIIYLKDASRTSVAFLHSEQLFPKEQMLVELIDGTRWSITVVRCMKRCDQCYEIGATYVDAE